ncbi:hypothetical protein IAR50_004808 [Cryptococcus sp. DSM 104548]
MSDEEPSFSNTRSVPTCSTPPPDTDRQPSKGAAAILQLWREVYSNKSLKDTLSDPAFAAQTTSAVDGEDDVSQNLAYTQEAISFLPLKAQESMISALGGISVQVQSLASGAQQEEFQRFFDSAMQNPRYQALADSLCDGQPLPSLQETIRHFGLDKGLAEAFRDLEVDTSGGAPKRTFTMDTVTTQMSTIFDAYASEDMPTAQSPMSTSEDAEFDEDDEQIRQGVEGKEFL